MNDQTNARILAQSVLHEHHVIEQLNQAVANGGYEIVICMDDSHSFPFNLDTVDEFIGIIDLLDYLNHSQTKFHYDYGVFGSGFGVDLIVSDINAEARYATRLAQEKQYTAVEVAQIVHDRTGLSSDAFMHSDPNKTYGQTELNEQIELANAISSVFKDVFKQK